MKEQRNRRAAAAAAATAMVAAATLAGAPALARPASAGANVVDDVLSISGTNAGDRITIDFTPLDSVVVDLGGTQRHPPLRGRHLPLGVGGPAIG